MSKPLSRFTNSSISLLAVTVLLSCGITSTTQKLATNAQDHLKEPVAESSEQSGTPIGQGIVKILRQQIIANGFVRATSLYQNVDEPLASVGEVIFKSTKLSLNGDISCITCHQDKFNSEDGIPNAAAVGGTGVGPERMMSGARLLPRKALPFWGRGGKNFNVFFWDGRVSYQNGHITSQFGSAAPSNDVLVVAEHLPVVEIREMLDDGDPAIAAKKLESVADSQVIYQAIASRLVTGEPEAAAKLAQYLQKKPEELTYTDFARSIAAHIRYKFRIKETKLERFAYENGTLSESELRGALVFYGNGKCITCHGGAYFSDFNFHTVAVPQLGFGKNGFGIDYGRYNATFDTRDMYRFRTPPLFNTAKNSFYTHSGGIANLRDAITAHFDPLSLVDLQKMTGLQRNDFYRRLTYSQETASRVGFLSQTDIENLVNFLKTLSFN
jgi:cytochrome c peroxidase